MDIAGDTYSVAGSSPLARGLLVTSGNAIDFARIIPARAGFTSSFRGTRRPGRDHPRSRGVYVWGNIREAIQPGSSPLARGLRRGSLGASVRGGIIPARAGFTRSTTSPPGSSADHPRSRGVYLYDAMKTGTVSGSSPLARGLLGLLRAGHVPPGIIPARAGFTGLRGGAGCCRRDHPRSRGVYPFQAHVTHSHSGIIPARAGFTRPPR